MASVLSLLLLELQAFVSQPPRLPCPGFLPTAQDSRGRGTFVSPSPPLLAHRGREEGRAWPAAGGLLFPDGDCQTLSASDTHGEPYIRIPGMCNCPASPSAAFHSITCQVSSVSPRAEVLSPTQSLCIWSTHALGLSKYLSQAKGRHIQSEWITRSSLSPVGLTCQCWFHDELWKPRAVDCARWASGQMIMNAALRVGSLGYLGEGAGRFG